MNQFYFALFSQKACYTKTLMTPIFLLSSRLGLLHKPQGQLELNTGVENGPAALCSPELIEALDLLPTSFTYSNPDRINPEQYFEIFGAETREFSQQMADVLQDTQAARPLSIALGGDHSVSLAHISALLQTQADPSKTGILMLDSHSDINLLKTSPTGNIHGMWLRPIVDHFDVPELDQLVPNKVIPRNLIYLGNLDLDPAERQFIDREGVRTFSVDHVRAEKQIVEQELKQWFSQLDHLHLSIDVDGFDKSLTPATGIPCPAGFVLEDVLSILRMVKELPHWSLDIVEVNPQKPGAAETVTFAQALLRTLLQK